MRETGKECGILAKSGVRVDMLGAYKTTPKLAQMCSIDKCRTMHTFDIDVSH